MLRLGVGGGDNIRDIEEGDPVVEDDLFSIVGPD
jgi:hypothetical protein